MSVSILVTWHQFSHESLVFKYGCWERLFSWVFFFTFICTWETYYASFVVQLTTLLWDFIKINRHFHHFHGNICFAESFLIIKLHKFLLYRYNLHFLNHPKTVLTGALNAAYIVLVFLYIQYKQGFYFFLSLSIRVRFTVLTDSCSKFSKFIDQLIIE
jgi:hypothetical protein